MQARRADRSIVLRVGLRRVAALDAAQPECHDPLVAPRERPFDGCIRALHLEVAHDVGNEAHANAVLLLRLGCRLAERGSDLLPVAAVGEMSRDREMHFAVEHVLHRLLGQEVARHQVEVSHGV